MINCVLCLNLYNLKDVPGPSKKRKISAACYYLTVIASKPCIKNVFRGKNKLRNDSCLIKKSFLAVKVYLFQRCSRLQRDIRAGNFEVLLEEETFRWLILLNNFHRLYRSFSLFLTDNVLVSEMWKIVKLFWIFNSVYTKRNNNKKFWNL